MTTLALLVFGSAFGYSQEKGADTEAAAKKGWLATKEKLQAAGLVLDLAKLTPPAIPDDTNFAAHPLIAETYSKEARDDISSTRLGKIKLRNLPGFADRRTPLNRADGGLYDLANLVGDPNASREAAAKKVLEGLGTWQSELDSLVEAARRPACQFPIRQEELINDVANSVPFVPVKHLFLRAICHLELQNRPQALADTKALIQLSQHSRSNQYLIGTLISNAITNFALEAIRDGIAQQRWDEVTLLLLESELANLSFQDDFPDSVQFELAFSTSITEATIGGTFDPDEIFPKEIFDHDEAEREDLFAPRELYKRLGASCTAVFETFFQGDPSKPVDLPTALKKIETMAGSPEETEHPMDSKILLRSIVMGGAKALQQQAMLNNCRIGIAIERYRLKHDKLPAKLADLSPRYLDKIPPDPMTGDPPRYIFRPDGRPMIYSLGWDGDDDGGSPATTRSISDVDGDWVWLTHSPADKQ